LSDLIATGRYHSPSFDHEDDRGLWPEIASVESRTVVFRTAPMAHVFYDTAAAPALATCFGGVLRKSFAARRFKVEDFAVRSLPFPRFGQRIAVYRMSVLVTKDNVTLRVTTDLVTLMIDRVDVVLAFQGVGSGKEWTAVAERRLVGRIAARAK
jgi:hypothetical protein